LGKSALNRGAKFETVHCAGQLYVREDKVYGSSRFEVLHCLICIARFDYAQTCLAQYFCYLQPNQDFILNDEHRVNLSLGRLAWVPDHRVIRKLLADHNNAGSQHWFRLGGRAQSLNVAFGRFDLFTNPTMNGRYVRIAVVAFIAWIASAG
jgi:hypothetical protein